MENERDISKHLKLIFPEHREFYTLTVHRLDAEEGFCETIEGHTAGNLCQGMLGDVYFSEEKRRLYINNYLKHIAEKKENT